MNGTGHRETVMASVAAKPPQGEGHPSRGRPLSEVGMTREAARELRARLASFAREWGDPRMDVYDRES